MRIAGANVPDNKRLEVGLTYIFGIGPARSKDVLKKAGISIDKKAQDLDDKELNAIKTFVEEYKIEGDLRRDRSSNIKRLKDIQCYRGIRHAKRLPTRGQHTKNNTRTVRGNVRVCMGSGRKKADKK